MRVTSKRSDLPKDAAPGMTEAASAFEADWSRRQSEIENNPVLAFLDRHELAGSPNELTICGVADVKLTLGDLRMLVRHIR